MDIRFFFVDIVARLVFFAVPNPLVPERPIVDPKHFSDMYLRRGFWLDAVAVRLLPLFSVLSPDWNPCHLNTWFLFGNHHYRFCLWMLSAC